MLSALSLPIRSRGRRGRLPASALVAGLVVVVVGAVVGGCSGTAGPGGSASATSSAAAPSPARPAPSPSGDAAGSGTAGGTGSGSGGPGSGVVGGNPGSGVTPMPPSSGGGSLPGGGGSVPAPSPTIVTPVAGLLNVHDVRAVDLAAHAAGGHIIATVSWWSGPPPCSALAEVAVDRAGSAFSLTVREGAVQLGVACPAIAMYKAAVVDLGPVAAGTYTVAVTGVDTPRTVVVSG